MAAAAYAGIGCLLGGSMRGVATPVLRSLLCSGGSHSRSLSLASPQAYLCTVQQERQKEDDKGQNPPGPVHTFKLPPNPGGHNAECRGGFYHGLPLRS
jgi:hypothetical protein